MNRTSTWLLEYQHNIYSQSGEDGIIEKILETIPVKDHWCVEFGAWDGLYLTNTRNLIESKCYSAVLIEADKERFLNLQHNYAEYHNIITINEFVGFTENNNLDKILSSTPVPADFDLLSIDIDGNDYHVWKAVTNYKPKVIVIEFNPTIPTAVQFIQRADPTVNQGSSLLSLIELGKEKGYELVSVLKFNAFFVRQEYYQLFQLESNAPEILRTNLEAVTYLFSGFDGTIFLQGCCKLPWHGIELNESKLQRLPRYLRKYSGNYTMMHKIAFSLFMVLTEPGKVIKGLIKRIASD